MEALMSESLPKRDIQRRKLHEGVTEFLLEDIKNGVYAVGQKLPSERALMEEFGVGRPAIRDSMAKLARMGIVDIRPGMRTRVRKVTIAPLLDEMDAAVKMTLLTPEGQRHMQQLRMLFESFVVRFIASNITDEQLHHIEEIQKGSEGSLAEPKKFADMDVLFHRSLGEVTGNPLVTGIYDAFAKWLLEQRLTNVTNNPERPKCAFDAHARILDALRDRDPDAAEKAVISHINDVQDHYWSVVEKNSKK
jgi:GntR family transcriptional repressor for pyruvate dehydrogenase complex